MSGHAAIRPLLIAALVVAVGALSFLAGRVTTPPAADADRPPATTGLVSSGEGAESDRAGDIPGKTSRRRREGTAVTFQPSGDARTAGEVLLQLVLDASVAQQSDANARADGLRVAATRAHGNAAASAARAIAEEIRKERAFLADQALGGTMELLRSLDSAKTHPFTLVEDPVAFAAHFERHVEGPDIDGSSFDGRTVPEPGSVLRFPPGFHSLNVSDWGRSGAFPADIVIEGAGRDRTIVAFNEFNASREVRSLTFRDLTVDAADDYLTDHRGSDPTTIRFERCRVIGFDMGAGGSVMLACRTAALFATDTRFEGGYGRSPGSGNLFRVRSGLLARLESCVFVGPLRSVFDSGSEATYVFDDCRFENVKVPLDRPPAGVRFVGCESVEVPVTDVHAARLAWQIGMVPKESDAHVVDGVAGTVPEGTIGPVAVVFPAGMHNVNLSQIVASYRGPLIVRGQGRDATLLRISGASKSQAVVVRDATLDLGSGNLGLGSARVALIDRVRLVRWDSGAGGSTALRHGSGALIVLRDSEVLDGFGRNPGRGYVHQIGSGSTLRIERSRVELVGSHFFSSGRVHVVDSVISGLLTDETQERSHFSNNVTLERTQVVPRANGTPRPKKPRPLTDLNSGWTDTR